MASLIRSLSSESQSLKDQGKSRTKIIAHVQARMEESQSLKDQGKSRTAVKPLIRALVASQSLKDQGKSRTSSA